MFLTRLHHALAGSLKRVGGGARPLAAARKPRARLQVEDLEARTVPVCTTPVNDCFLTQVYPDVLNRPVDPAGLSGYSRALAGGVTRTQVGLALTTSAEYRTAVVQAAYSQFLRRQADPGGLGAFTEFLALGGTIGQMHALILGSLEYSLRAGNSSPNGFLNSLYQDVLTRPVDQGAEAAFTQQLALGVARSTIALTVLSSLERASNLVHGYYSQFLHRAADSAGLQFWVGSLVSGSLRQEEVVAFFVGSNEYLVRP